MYDYWRAPFDTMYLQENLLTGVTRRNTMYYRRAVIFMAISLRLNEQETLLIKNYAALHNVSVSELVRQAVLEKI